MVIFLAYTSAQLESNVSTEVIVSGQQPTTQMVWIWKPVYVGEPRRSLIGCYGFPFDGGNSAFQIGINTSTLFAVWGWGGTPLVSFSNSIIPTSQWNFFVYRWDGLQNTMFLNNSVVATSTILPQSRNITNVFVNGFPSGGLLETTNDYYVADYRIYNRVLTDNEIQTIYYSRGKDNKVYGLRGRWLFNERNVNSQANICYDYSILGNHFIGPVSGNINVPLYSDNFLDGQSIQYISY